MTDTTDIKALRIKAANVIGLLTAESLMGSFALDSLADVFDDMFRVLEAERQRADDAAALNKHLDLSIRKSEGVLRERAEKAKDEMNVERNAAINLSNHLSDCAGKLRAANAEIAALKAKLDNPVVLPKTNGFWNAEEEAYERGVTDSRKAIFKAGFTVKGE